MAASYKKGDILLSSQPLAHVLSSKELGVRCEECFHKSNNLLKCSSCKLVRYCNKSCQKKAWLLHKYECVCLRQTSSGVPTDSVRLMYRLMLQLQYYDGAERNEQVFTFSRNFSQLLSHSEDIKRDPKRCEDLLHICQLLSKYSGNTLQLPTPAQLLDIFGKMVINSLSISDDEMRPIGVGLYLGVSVLDHSCEPNAVVIFSGTTAYVRCLKAFSNDGQKINARVSYIDILQSTCERRLALQTQYYFTCECMHCMETDRDRMMAATFCPIPTCDGAIRHISTGLSCDTCSHRVSDDSYTSRRDLAARRAAGLVITCRKLTKCNQSVCVLEQCEDGLRDTILHPHHVCRLQLEELMFDSSIDMSQWDKAVVHGRIVLAGYNLYLQPTHPIQGVHRMKLAKILLFLSQVSEAQSLLLAARNVICVSHGTYHVIYEQLAQLLNQATAELQYTQD